MLRGVRVAIKYFTIGLLAGLLLAPRKGDETRTLLMDRAREYVGELMGAAQDAAGQAGDKVEDLTRGTYETEHRGYDNAASSGIQ